MKKIKDREIVKLTKLPYGYKRGLELYNLQANVATEMIKDNKKENNDINKQELHKIQKEMHLYNHEMKFIYALLKKQKEVESITMVTEEILLDWINKYCNSEM